MIPGLPDYDPASGGWIGVDLDGTLAEAEEGVYGPPGKPIQRMVEFVKELIASGWEVRIFTARTGGQSDAVHAWCRKHIGTDLLVTNEKDTRCFRIYDDRARQVVYNSGQVVCLEVVNAALAAANKDAALGNQLVALLTEVAGEHGQSEGAAECLTRILKERRDLVDLIRPVSARCVDFGTGAESAEPPVDCLTRIIDQWHERWQQLQRAQHDVQHWKNNHASMVATNRLLRKERDSLASAVTVMPSRGTYIVQDGEQLQPVIDELRNRLAAAEADNDEVRKNLGDCQISLSKCRHSLAVMETERDTWKKRSDNWKRSFGEERGLLVQTQTERDAWKLKAEDAQSALDSQIAIYQKIEDALTAVGLPDQDRPTPAIIMDHFGMLNARLRDAERDAEAVKMMTVLGDDFYLTHSNTLKKWIISVEDGKYGKEWADANLRKALSKAKAATAHMQLPCIYCGEGYETIQPGPCPKNPMSPGNKPAVEAEQPASSGEVASLEFLRDNVLSQHHIEKHGVLDAIQRHVADYEALRGLVSQVRAEALRAGLIIGEPLPDFITRLSSNIENLINQRNDAHARLMKLDGPVARYLARHVTRPHGTALGHADPNDANVNPGTLPTENMPCVTPPFVPGPEAAHVGES